MSDYQADSELMRLCAATLFAAGPVSADLFEHSPARAERLLEVSHGAFDVTVGPYVRLWRFSRKRLVLPTLDELAAARTRCRLAKKLRLDARNRTVTLLVPHMRLDLGGPW